MIAALLKGLFEHDVFCSCYKTSSVFRFAFLSTKASQKRDLLLLSKEASFFSFRVDPSEGRYNTFDIMKVVTVTEK